MGRPLSMQGITASDIPLYGRGCGSTIVELCAVASANFYISICSFHCLIALEASVILAKVLILSVFHDLHA